MKHECKTMREVSASIKEFNDGVQDITALTNLSLRLYDSPHFKGHKVIDPLAGNGILLDILIYGKKKKESVCIGRGMRWSYCPFCGKKLGK